jgi:hypothetical protein
LDVDGVTKVDKAHDTGIENLDLLRKEAFSPKCSGLITSFTNKLAEIMGQGFIKKSKHDDTELELQQDKSIVENQ